MFAATQAFNKAVPVEEQLRQMSISENPQMIPAAQKMQTEQHLKQLITRYTTVTDSNRQSVTLLQAFALMRSTE